MTDQPRSAYAEAVRALSERGRFGVRLGLERTQALLSELGDPHLGIRGALVGGTNGKGSVLAMCGAVLREAGYRVGETPKPHLVTYRERLQIDGRPIEPAAFTALVRRVLPLADRVAPRHGEPTEFELLTAMLFRWFADEGVDVALVEVGLGGRLDATNVWDGGVAAITNVDLDHMDRLGPTIEAIAREKAPIIKRGDLAVTGAVEPARGIIRRRATRVGAQLQVVEPWPVLAVGRDGLVVDGPGGPVTIGLRGRHQAANVAVAEAVLDGLAKAGIATTIGDHRAAGYLRVRWPGRLELLDVDGREMLLDGAHNPAGARALATALDDLRPHLRPGRITLVIASMADKDIEAVIRDVFTAATLRDADVIATSVQSTRSLPADALGARVRLAVRNRVTVIADADAALTAALGAGDGPVVVAGSLYLVGVARARFVDDPQLRDPDD